MVHTFIGELAPGVKISWTIVYMVHIGVKNIS